jgi:uncharacterized protein YecE (DUF72 family)
MAPQAEGELRVGTCGYSYPHWRGVFYPRELAASRWFAYYATRFDTVEIDNTFYRLPAPEVFGRWRRQAPPGFRYALKLSRYGSHFEKLKSPAETIGRFLRAARELGETLGPILVQLPPRWRVDRARLAAFLDQEPAELRWTVELRDPSWLRDDVFETLREHGAALCLHDLIEGHPRVVTTDWVYLRFHGGGASGAYSRQKLAAEAARIRGWLAEGLDVYAFFNNDAGGHAVRNALDLRRYCRRA